MPSKRGGILGGKRSFAFGWNSEHFVSCRELDKTGQNRITPTLIFGASRVNTTMSVNAASLVDLKAELARKQAEFKEERLNPELRDLRLQVRSLLLLPAAVSPLPSWRELLGCWHLATSALAARAGQGGANPLLGLRVIKLGQTLLPLWRRLSQLSRHSAVQRHAPYLYSSSSLPLCLKFTHQFLCLYSFYRRRKS